MFQDLAGYRNAHFFDDPQNVALCGVTIGTQYKIGRGKSIKMRDMAMDKSGRIVQLPKLLRCRRRIYLVYCICGLTRGQVV